MDDRESTRRAPSHAAPPAASPKTGAPASSPEHAAPHPGDTGSFISAANDELLSGTGSIPLIASSTGSFPTVSPSGSGQSTGGESFSTASAPAAPRYVRKRKPHRSQGTLDDLTDDSVPSASYTHDSNISVGGATPLSGMVYSRSRSNMSRVKKGTRYGQYLEIPKGRRTIFASRERARRRRSVLALFVVITLLVLAAMFLWNMMQEVLG